jgi:hypothetical protein
MMPEPKASFDPNKERADVYVALLEHIHGYQELYLLDVESVIPTYPRINELSEILQEAMPTLELEAYHDFLEVNSERQSLAAVFAGSTNVVTIDWDDYARVSEGTYAVRLDRARLRQQYGTDEVTHVSWVGFNSDRDQALVYASTGLSDIHGLTYLVFLEKEHDGWIVKNEMGGEWIQ